MIGTNKYREHVKKKQYDLPCDISKEFASYIQEALEIKKILSISNSY